MERPRFLRSTAVRSPARTPRLFVPLFVTAALIGSLAAGAPLRSFAQTQNSFAQGATSSAQAAVAGAFNTRIFRDAAGEHKYVVFVPQNYTPQSHSGDKQWPAILYLHGAGERGTDGLLPTTVGIGPFVKERAATFPFFVVFPQCEDLQGRILTAWSASSPDGRRALAIFDSVAREFSIDSQHCVLTGWSMGGYGTWSLGAADPKRWSALVPVAGGGDPAWAPRLRDMPIWAFQGGADRVVAPRECRQMIEAIRSAGGHPLYNEIADAGHDVWRIAYSDNRLYDWMLSPSTSVPGGAAAPSTAAAATPGSRNPAAESGPAGAAGLAQPGARPKTEPAPAAEGPFVPAVVIPSALYVRLGNDAIRAIAHSAPRLIPAGGLSGRINDIYSSTESSGYTFGVQFARITYSAQVERVSARAYAEDRLNIQLGLRNVVLAIGNTYVQGSGRSAMAGPIYIVIGQRAPVWLSFDVTPRVEEGRLKLELVGTRFEIPNDNWYVTPPYGVGVTGLGMTQERVASGLVEGIYGQKSRIEQEAAAIVPSLLPMFEDKLNFEEVSQMANAFWPLPVYRPRIRITPESAKVDDKGISFVMGVTAAAADPRKAPDTPVVERPAGIQLGSVPRDTDLRLGVAPGVLEPLTRMLVDEGLARVNVLDIPEKSFAVFADRKTLTEIFPDLASLPPNAAINAELVLASPVQVRDAQGLPSSAATAASRMAQRENKPVSVTALKANPSSPLPNTGPELAVPETGAPNRASSRIGAADAPRTSAVTSKADANGRGKRLATAVSPSDSASGPRSFEFVVPKARIAISVKDNPQAAEWKPYAELDFNLAQPADATILRRGFAERALRIGWVGEPAVKATAKFAPGYTPKNSEIHAQKVDDLFASAWRGWTQNGPASQVPVADVDFGYAKLRLDGVQWSPPVLSVLFDEAGIKISNMSKIDLVYEAKDAYSPWSEPYTLKPGKSAEFKIADPMLFRRVVGDQFIQTYTLPAGSHVAFRSPPSGGAANVFLVPPTTGAQAR